MTIEVHWHWHKKANITLMLEDEVPGYIQYLKSYGATKIKTQIHFPTT